MHLNALVKFEPVLSVYLFPLIINLWATYHADGVLPSHSIGDFPHNITCRCLVRGKELCYYPKFLGIHFKTYYLLLLSAKS